MIYSITKKISKIVERKKMGCECAIWSQKVNKIIILVTSQLAKSSDYTHDVKEQDSAFSLAQQYPHIEIVANSRQ